MALTRCRNFDDEGAPIRGGCYQQNCRFVHPDNQAWKTAVRYKGGSWQGSSSKGHRGNSGHWKSTSDDFSAPTSTNTAKLPETGSRWGKSSTAEVRPPSARKSSMPNEGDRFKTDERNLPPEKVGWTAPSNDWGSSTGWGQTSTEWGQGSSTWPTSPKAGNNSGWDQASGPTSADASQSENSSGPGQAFGSTQTSKPSGWGQTSGTTQPATTATRDPTPPRKAPPLPGRFGASASQKPHLKPLNTNVNAAQPSKSSTATPLQPFSAQTPITAKKGDKKSLAVGNLQTAAAQPSSSKQTATMQVKPYPKQYVGPSGRGALFSDTLRRMQDAIIAQIIYQRVEDVSSRWKNTQNSEIYGHATPQARKILDGNRNEFTRKVAEARKQRDVALTDLIHLPDYDAKRPVINIADTMEQVAKYTKELQQWFVDARIHERLLLEKKADTRPTGPTQDEAETTAEITATALIERGNWSWAELSDAIKVLDVKFESASEQVYSKKFVNYDPEIFQDNLSKSMSVDSIARTRSETPEPEVPLQRTEALDKAANTAGAELGAQATRAAMLYNRLKQMDEDYKSVISEKKQIIEMCDQADLQFIGFKKERVALEAEIEDLINQLQNLHLHKRPSPEAPSFDYDDVVYQLIPRFQQTLEADIQSIFGPLRQRAEECQDGIKRQIDDVLNPILRKTEEMKRIAESHA